MKIKKKSPAGRKPVEDKKVVVNLFIRQSELDKRGGKEEVQKQCYEFLGVSTKQRTTAVINAGGQCDEPTIYAECFRPLAFI